MNDDYELTKCKESMSDCKMAFYEGFFRLFGRQIDFMEICIFGNHLQNFPQFLRIAIILLSILFKGEAIVYEGLNKA